MSVSQQGHANLEPVLQLLFRFLDLSRDLEHATGTTSSFNRDGGRISYVLDENIFEIFVRPDDDRGELVSLHSRLWSDVQPGAKRPPDQPSFPAQSALLTSEYLLSGELPGQADPRLFMTEWHRWELAYRMSEVAAVYDERMKDVSDDKMMKRFETLRMALENFSRGRDGGSVIGEIDSDLQKDVADLDAKQISIEDQKIYVSTRLAVKILAEDREIEPIEQLRRLRSAPIHRRLFTLHLAYRPKPNDRDAIEQDARRWFQSLLDECKARKIDVHHKEGHGRVFSERRQARSRTAIWNDARSLAFIRWAAVHGVEPGEKLVFVTADTIVFDVYRKWYANLDPADPCYLEPFILRRLTQYAPVFNLTDARNQLGQNVRLFFDQLQNVLEIMLLPLNLSRLANKAGEEIITRMRELTALRLLSPAPISTDVQYASLVSAIERREIGFDLQRPQELLDQWRRIERTAIGVADEYFRARLNDTERKLSELKVGEKIDSAALKTYIGELIGDLLSGTLQLWLPLAQEFIDAWRPRVGRMSRAPIPFQFEVRVGGAIIDVAHAMDRWLNSAQAPPIVPPDAWPGLREAPDMVFAIAACLALASDDWSNAHHFAEMALRVDVDRRSRSASKRPEDPVQRHELKYLYALAERFRIGGLSPPLNTDSRSKVKQGYQTARAMLDDCVEFHERQTQDARGRLRMIRALSERAALHLFYAAGMTPAVRYAAVRRASPQERAAAFVPEESWDSFSRWLPQEAAQALASARADLHRCLQCEASLPEGMLRSQADLFKKLEQQFLINIAAAEVLKRLLHTTPRGASNEEQAADGGLPDASLIKRIRQLHASLGPRLSSLLQAELLGFLCLVGGPDDRKNFAQIARGGLTGKPLSLDVALFDAIRESTQLFAEQHPVS